MNAGAQKAPDFTYYSPNSPVIAQHRYGVQNFTARHQIMALHFPDDHHLHGVFTLAHRVSGADRPWQEAAHKVRFAELLAGNLEIDTPDQYVSQQSFWRWRRIADLKHIGASYVDLDYRKRVRWSDARPEDVLLAAMRVLDDCNMPSPSYALSTGNGLCLVWVHSFVPRAALPRWTAVQKALATTLDAFGSDKNALDAARVFRVVGSRNSRASDWRNETVRALYVQGDPERLRKHAYDFDELVDEVLPITRAELVSLRAERVKRRSERSGASIPKPTFNLTLASYYEAVLTDLQRLRRHRHGDNGALPTGERDEWLFIASCAMAYLSPPAVLEREILALCSEAAGWNETEARSRMSAVFRRARASMKGETILDVGGEATDPRYRFKANTIIERLEITSAEMEAADLHALVDRDRRSDLNTIRTRKSRHRRGAKPREQAKADRLALGKRALHQSSYGKSVSDIALIEGVSNYQVSKAMKEARGSSQ